MRYSQEDGPEFNTYATGLEKCQCLQTFVGAHEHNFWWLLNNEADFEEIAQLCSAFITGDARPLGHREKMRTLNTGTRAGFKADLKSGVSVCGDV